MPSLSTKLHLDMLNQARGDGQPEKQGLYGLHWGDPDKEPILKNIRDQWLGPYVRADHDAVEIGPGGGRWTRYMLGFRHIYAVDYHQELLDELRKNFAHDNISFLKNNGSDFPSIGPRSIDYIFSFGVFVHLDIEIIASYMKELKTIIKDDGNIVIQYADNDKEAARRNASFSRNNPIIMRAIVKSAGFHIVQEDTESLWHSSLMRFQPAPP
jgi:hypothetical protein